jgi:hypothetical protein
MIFDIGMSIPDGLAFALAKGWHDTGNISVTLGAGRFSGPGVV